MADGSLYAVEKLLANEQVSFRPHGNSMTPIIKSGQLVTIQPVATLVNKHNKTGIEAIEVGNVVLCKVNGNRMLHLVTAIKGSLAKGTLMFQISNNHGHTNGWCSSKHIYGKLISVE